MNRKHSIVSSIFLLLLTAAMLISCTGQAPADPEARIAAVFSALGVTDAQFREKVSDPGRNRDGCLLYTSDSTQMGYYFEPDTGVLKTALHYSRIGSTYREKASGTAALMPMQASAENRTATLLQYAESCIGESLIGELQLVTRQDEGSMHRYTATEFYDGIETGTTVMFSCTPEGQITMVKVAIGSVFEKNRDGSYRIAGGDKLIGEEAAIEAALSGMNARFDPSEVSEEITCKLDATEDMLVYTVKIPFTDENSLSRTYSVAVNAHTGELFYEAISK